MADDFMLAEEPYAQPFDFGQAPQAKPDKRQLLKLALVLSAAAAGGGRGAVQGALSSWNQLNEQQQAMAQRQQALAQQDAYRRQQLAQQAAQNRQTNERAQMTARNQFVSGLPGMVEEFDSPEAVRAALPLLRQQATGVGVDPNAVEAAVLESATPTRLQQRQAEKYIGKMKGIYGNDWMQQTAQMTHVVGGEQLPLDEVMRRAGAPGAPKATAKVDVPNTPEEQFYQQYAKERGKNSFSELPTAEQAKARKQWMQADDRPPSQNPQNSRIDTRVDRIVNSFNGHPLVKEYNEVQAQVGIIQRVVNGQWSGPGDMATVFTFMKALDPNSVVRETEYANAARSGNIFAGWAAKFNGALNPNGGFLSEQVRRDFLKTVTDRLSVKTKQYDNLRKQLVDRVDRIRAGAPETGDEALVQYSSGGEEPVETAPQPVRKAPGKNPFRGGK